ncbi:type IV secretion system protein VirB10 [Brevundimonas sp. NPDC046655]|uniref:type IV secretion system protein VirB10 n=1 Tax=unclassified Brevundimonas TaxID=2622653 RepID=UPI003850211A
MNADDPIGPLGDANASEAPTPVRNPPAGDRVISPVAGRLSGPKSRWITLAALTAGCGALLFATWDRGDRPPSESADEPARRFVPFEPARRRPEPPLLSTSDPSAPSLTGEPVVPAIDGAASASPEAHGPSPEEQRRVLAESAQRAPVLAYSRSGPRPTTGRTPAIEHAVPGEATALDRLRQAGSIERARADRLSDRRFLITAGSTIPCVLQTAMDSATPGFAACIVPRDVWSDDGSVVLMERGTRILGEYRSGLQRGRGRLFVLWTRAVTPDGVTVTLASPAADGLGRAGFDGRIDSHFWERFGGALLLSIVDGATSAALDLGADRSGIRVPSDAASTALEDSVGIPPTLRKDQGGEVSIFVARDLDFASVYRLKAR